MRMPPFDAGDREEPFECSFPHTDRRSYLALAIPKEPIGEVI
jgi:hypothetical protein